VSFFSGDADGGTAAAPEEEGVVPASGKKSIVLPKVQQSGRHGTDNQVSRTGIQQPATEQNGVDGSHADEQALFEVDFAAVSDSFADVMPPLSHEEFTDVSAPDAAPVTAGQVSIVADEPVPPPSSFEEEGEEEKSDIPITQNFEVSEMQPTRVAGSDEFMQTAIPEELETQQLKVAAQDKQKREKLHLPVVQSSQGSQTQPQQVVVEEEGGKSTPRPVGERHHQDD
jgi:hypothetical protein